MYLVDYHTHTRCSFDSKAELSDQVKRAAVVGLKELCTTDHCDLVDEQGKRAYDVNWAAILEQFERVRSGLDGSLKLRLGLELGMPQVDPECARRILAGAPLDFVLGSVHNLSLDAGGHDLSRMQYASLDECYAALDNYFRSLLDLAKLPDCYDVLAHVTYPIRYMKGAVTSAETLQRYRENLREIFRVAIHSGRGIEVNTCRGRTIEDWREVLALYRDCGGEIITIGSDAHNAENVGKGLVEVQKLAKAAGFRYQAIYNRRTPQFVRL